MTDFYSSITSKLTLGASRAALGLRSFRSDALREHLRTVWEGAPGSKNAFLSDLIFESTFNWCLSRKTFKSLSGKLLHPDLVNAMIYPLKSHKDEYAFPANRQPYKHQLKSWKQLIQKQPARSVLVSSGTGSGKTECFLVPILNDLAHESQKSSGRLIGTRALFLYPLNALIKSQRDRLLAWSEPFEGRIRFCLFNGDTPNEAKKSDLKSEIRDRKTLRASPPPILVTNSTMLEYMLVRNEDRPIIEKSQGKLRWIVIDEAHTYIGSQAADLTLLIRRVLHAFACNIEQVHFVATSATIANTNEKNTNTLREFLADIAGVNPNRISVITGYRETPDLKMLKKNKLISELPEVNDLKTLSPELLYDKFCTYKPLRKIRKILMKKPTPLTEITNYLVSKKQKNRTQQTLQWLDLCSQAINGKNEPFLPLRGHIFQRAISGIWACANDKCSGLSGTHLCDGDWSFGKIFLERRLYCDSCKSPVFEVVQCNVCGSSYLIALEEFKKHSFLKQYQYNQDEDEFQQELEPPDEGEQEDIELSDQFQEFRRLLVQKDSEHGSTAYLLNNRQIDSKEGISICLIVPDGNDRLRCPCCESRELNNYLFSPIRIGAPFLLQTAIPIILNKMPAFRKKNDHLPHKGRRILSFTDSRQGTARFSTKLQLETERNFVRSILYHSVHDRIKSANQNDIEKIEKEIKALKQIKNPSSTFQNMIKEKQEQLKEMNSPALGRLSWDDAINRLLTNNGFRDWLLPPLKEQTFGFKDRHLAELCLWREFMRRPKRQFSLEVFGLLRLGYSEIDRIRELPSVAKQYNITIEDWRNLAHIFMDFKIRTEMSVAIPRDMKRWIGYPGSPGYIIAPDQDKTNYLQKYWPSTKTRITRKSRIVRLIAIALNFDLEDPSDRSVIEELLIELWRVIHPILSRTEYGYHLELNQQVDFVQVREAWICPITRRLLPMTFKGITPYLPPNKTAPSLSECVKVKMPSTNNPFWLDKNTISSQEWLETDPDINNLRKSGVWTDLSDRIAAFSKYFVSTEHSAQISGPTLTQREKLFKEGRINLLSCSTTMEMGVDIGGLSTITMNNVPPHPANFLQRAGRAGRRGETKALSYTLCKSTPHGESVFQNPLWPFTTQLSIPQVSLQSQPIVQRHIQSLVLSYFLNQQSPDDILKLSCGWFFGADLEDQSSPCNHFTHFCQNDAINNQLLHAGINHVTQRTILAGVSIQNLLHRTREMIKNIIEQWENDYKSLRNNLDLVKTAKGNSKAEQAINFQIKRMTNEYLLKELANQNFIPAYGFASGLACLITTTIEQIKLKKEKQKKSREDNKAMRAGYPSRPLAIAIRDYAPGTDTVLDGRVYRSSGITLNWQLPAELEGPPEIQSLRWVWQCKTCGGNATRNTYPSACPQCGENNSDKLRRYEYIQPSGFAVDIRCEPHNDISIPQYLPVRDPLVSLEGSDWLSLPTSVLGRYRFSNNGSLFYRTDGNHGEGFALCLRCGRADAMLPGGDPPVIFTEPHKRLRGGKDNDLERECPGSHEEWAIKYNIRMGVNIITDVLELQLNQLNGQPLDRELAYSTGVSLRLALARKLGVDDQEISSVVNPSIDAHGHKAWSIYLFDTTQGGAGFVKYALQELPTIFSHAQKIVRCPKKCDTACHACLMDFNTQYHLDLLNSSRTLELLNNTYLNAFELPSHLKVLGANAKLEMEPLSMAIYRELQRMNIKEIRIYLDGNTQHWELLDWWMYQELLSIAKTDCKMVIIVPQNILKHLERSQKDELFVIAISTHANLYAISPEGTKKSKAPKNAKIIEIGDNTVSVCWYATTQESLIPGNQWGSGIKNTQYVRVKSNKELTPVPKGGSYIQTEELKQSEKHFTETIITSELNGSIKTFGKKAWQLIMSNVPKLEKQLKDHMALEKIVYTDRYLRSPMVLMLLKMLLNELQSFKGGLHNTTSIEIHTTELDNRNIRSPYLISHDWLYPDDRKKVFESILTFHNKPLFIEKHRNAIPHARELCLSWTDKVQFIIRFDQGMGYWKAEREPFPFDYSVEEQVEKLKKANFNILGISEAYPSHLYIK